MSESVNHPRQAPLFIQCRTYIHPTAQNDVLAYFSPWHIIWVFNYVHKTSTYQCKFQYYEQMQLKLCIGKSRSLKWSGRVLFNLNSIVLHLEQCRCTAKLFLDELPSHTIELPFNFDQYREVKF